MRERERERARESIHIYVLSANENAVKTFEITLYPEATYRDPSDLLLY